MAAIDWYIPRWPRLGRPRRARRGATGNDPRAGQAQLSAIRQEGERLRARAIPGRRADRGERNADAACTICPRSAARKTAPRMKLLWSSVGLYRRRTARGRRRASGHGGRPAAAVRSGTRRRILSAPASVACRAVPSGGGRCGCCSPSFCSPLPGSCCALRRRLARLRGTGFLYCRPGAATLAPRSNGAARSTTRTPARIAARAAASPAWPRRRRCPDRWLGKDL